MIMLDSEKTQVPKGRAKMEHSNSDENDRKDSAAKDPEQSEVSEVAKSDEVGGPKGPEPTRYGDWEVKGRVSDF